MANLNEYFAGSGYAIHRKSLRRERLPQCCRDQASALHLGIRFMRTDGEACVLPLVKCSVCGRTYAVTEAAFMPIDHLLQYDVIPI